MLKVTPNARAEFTWSSPKGKFAGAGKEVSEELGRKPQSTDLNERHPFDVEILRIPAGKTPLHMPLAQRPMGILPCDFRQGASCAIRMGPPRLPVATPSFSNPTNLTNSSNHGPGDLVLYVVADNPSGEHAYYPDSKKWGVHSRAEAPSVPESLEYIMTAKNSGAYSRAAAIRL